MEWYVYIARCRDGSLYCGISPNVNRRIALHNNGLGAKSVKGKLPLILIYKKKIGSKILAARREREIKGWNRTRKLELVHGCLHRGMNGACTEE